MKIYPECIPCFFQQTLTTLQMATQDENLWLKGLNEVIKRTPELLKLPTPTHVGRVIHNLPKRITNNPDPYLEVKIKHTEEVLKLYPKLKQMVKNSQDPLFAALKIAVAGNMIDFARGGNFDFEKETKRIFNLDFRISDYNELKRELGTTDKVLYLADNAAETVFDKVLIEELIFWVGESGVSDKCRRGPTKKVIYAVRGSPVLNDATREDALRAGIDEVAEIFDSGTDAPGTVLEYCNPEFIELFNNSRLIISKGQGNHEALSEVKAPIYFLFKTKCPAVSKELGVNIGDIIFKKAS